MVQKSVKQPLICLQQRLGEDWLIGYDSREFYLLTQEFCQQFSQLPQPAQIILAQTNPVHFLAAFLAAVATESHVFLCNPHWVQQEWQQVFALVQPDLIVGKPLESSCISHNSRASQPPLKSGLIMLPTGGSSGKIRFAMHSWSTLMASVQGFYRYFDQQPVNSFCVLPLYHVSGLMQFLRSLTTNGRIAIVPYQTLKLGTDDWQWVNNFFISLVPTQLHYLLESHAHWLSRFRTVLLGGAPAWQELLDRARKYRIKLAPTYGMTETASQVATLKPRDFLAGRHSCGPILPHATLQIFSSFGKLLSTQETGIITIQGKSLCLGYYPQLFSPSFALKTDDLGYLDDQGYLHIVGRRSQKIITGGKNVFPQEVEAAILATQLVKEVCVIGLPDKKWGQIVVAIYVGDPSNISPGEIQLALKDKLSKFKQPKYWLLVDNLPRNEQGKINYQQLKEIATKQINQDTFLANCALKK